MIYECRKCPGVFGNSVDLTKHQRSHNHDISFKQESLNRSNFACSSCGMEFGSKDDLIGHIMLIHPAAAMREGLAAERGNVPCFKQIKSGYIFSLNNIHNH